MRIESRTATAPTITARAVRCCPAPRRMILSMAIGFIRADVLLLLAVANGAPVLFSMVFGGRCATPIDGGRLLRDGRPVFGTHKTWRGLFGGALATGAVGGLLSIGMLTAATFGFSALLGDLLSSFIKRRAGYGSGRDLPLLDQVPEALLPMLALYGPLGLNLVSLCATFVAFVVLAIGAAKVFTYRRTPGPDRRNR